MSDLVDIQGRDLIPRRETSIVDYASFDALYREATQSIEQQLKLEDQGWDRLGASSADVVTPAERIANVRASRLYYVKDPLGRQAIRLWTDYTFGSGMNFQAENNRTEEVLRTFWDAKINQPVLSARGQRKSCDKLLVDGELFFVVFLGSGGKATIRWVDPLEITEIVTDPEDIETVMFYKRQWTDRLGRVHTSTYYRSATNLANVTTKNAEGQAVASSEDGVVFHLTYNTIGQRGNPLLLPALDWIKQYRRFLASRVAIMLALSRFAWKIKVQGGQTAADAIKTKLSVTDDPPEAGSTAIENLGADLQPIKTESGAKNAEADGRMLKLQVSAATGWPEQYFGDISTGNLATAKTVELPVQKMCQSLQKVFADNYGEIDDLVLAHNSVPPDRWYVDRDFPPIAPKDVTELANALEKIVGIFPQFGDAPEVQQVALMALGIDDTAEVLDNIEAALKVNPDAKFARSLRELRAAIVAIVANGNGKGE